MKPLKMLIFDLDGTLANTLPICVSSCVAALRNTTGREYPDEAITKLFGLNEAGIMQKLQPDQWRQCFSAFLEAYDSSHNGLALFEGLPDVLQKLNERGVKLAIITGKSKEGAEISAKHLGLTPFFPTIHAGSAERNIKSDQIKSVLADEQLACDEVAYVGDTVSDIKSAREAGILAIAAAWADTADVTALNANAPDQLFETVEAFSKWVMSAVIATMRA